MRINKLMLQIARYCIPFLPRGKSAAIRMALYLFGDRFGGTIMSKDGRRFYVDKISLVKRHLFFLNEYEEYETNIIKKIIKTGDYVIDVGACFGWFTTLMSGLVEKSGKVFAFELAPHIAEECRKNVRLNNMESNTTIEDMALGEKDGQVDFIYSEDLGLGNLNPKGLTGGGVLKAGTGRIGTLDGYMQRNTVPKINFIKCDVDGAEVLFLRGARKTISSERPAIVIEASGAHGRSSCREIFEELSEFGYKFFSLHHKARLAPIEPSSFGGKFKSNILCLPDDKLGLLRDLRNI